MAKLIVEVDDKFIDWAGWAREALANGNIPGEVVRDEAPEPTVAADEPEDPWSAVPAKPAARPAPESASAPSSGGQPATPPTGAYEYTEDGKTHKFGVEGAPLCEHDRPAVLVRGKGQKREWKQWRCALSSTDRWKDKCEFSEWA